jgi:succinyl-CoA synthetase beta subunit
VTKWVRGVDAKMNFDDNALYRTLTSAIRDSAK